MGGAAAFSEAPRRPALRWHGGKWRLAPWIIAQFPPHRCYVEPFGGAASVLLRKPRAYAEVYNDLDDDVVNLFRVLQDEAAARRLKALLDLTPFARREFELSYQTAGDPVERARRLLIRAAMGFGSNAHSSTLKGSTSTGFRCNASRSGGIPAHDWRNYPEVLASLTARFRGVVIDNRDAAKVMAQHDGPQTLHYVDPPYQHDLRSQRGEGGLAFDVYRHEMDRGAHEALLAFLVKLDGMVVLSGYASQLYDDALPGWKRVERHAMADGASPRLEYLWINPAALAGSHAPTREPLP